MTIRTWWRRVLDWEGFWSRWLGLSLFGPAQLDDEHDPREALRRDYHRPHARRRAAHSNRGQRAMQALPGARTPVLPRRGTLTPDELADEVWEDESPAVGHDARG